MTNLLQCKSIDDVNEMLTASNEKSVLLFKHSTVCPISANAYSQVAKFAQANESLPVYIVLVREDRPVSLFIAEKAGINHQSPQAILFNKGKAVWDASHYSITGTAIQKALEENSRK